MAAKMWLIANEISKKLQMFSAAWRSFTIGVKASVKGKVSEFVWLRRRAAAIQIDVCLFHNDAYDAVPNGTILHADGSYHVDRSDNNINNVIDWLQQRVVAVTHDFVFEIMLDDAKMLRNSYSVFSSNFK